VEQAMQSLTTLNTQQVTSCAFSATLFADFVKWIDRSERTTQTYICNLRQFAAWMRFANVSTPKREDVIRYRDWLLGEHEAIELDATSPNGWKVRTDSAGRTIILECKATTVACYIRSVCQFFKWCNSCGLYPNIAENIHAPKVRHDFARKDALQPEDVLTIERNIHFQAERKTANASAAKKDAQGRVQRTTEQGARLRAMYLLAVTAGLRCIELSRAKVRDFQTVGRGAYLLVWGKGHSEPDQRKTLAPEVAKAITDYLNLRTDPCTGNSPLFVSTGNRSGGRMIASTTISKMLKKAMQDAGYNSERLTAHSLRHTAGTAAQVLTNDLYATQKYMRHSSPVTTQIYLHCQDDAKDGEIAQRIFDYFHAGQTAPTY
jgi:integrase/recombinase XerC